MDIDFKEREKIKMKLINILRIIFCKKIYINNLCDYFGNPQDVLDELQLTAKKSKILHFLLKKELEDFNRIVEEEYQDFLIGQSLVQEEQGGCVDCPWGNGEGGCTIPSCCYL